MKMKCLAGLCSLLILIMAGCAGRGAVSAPVDKPLMAPVNAQPTKAFVKLKTAGALPAGRQIGGVSATISYASGKGLSITPANVEVTGAGTGATLVPNTNIAGKVVLGLITVNGIAAGEFATLSFDVAKGDFLTAADFSVATAKVIDTETRTLDGIGVSIESVILQ